MTNTDETGRGGITPKKGRDNMARLNKNAVAHLNTQKVKAQLFDGRKVNYLPTDFVFWANMVTREVYAHSFDAELAGVVSGAKVADIDEDGNIIPVG